MPTVRRFAPGAGVHERAISQLSSYLRSVSAEQPIFTDSEPTAAHCE